MSLRGTELFQCSFNLCVLTVAPLPTCAHRGMGKVLHLGVLLFLSLFPFFLQQTCAIRQDVQNASQQSQ